MNHLNRITISPDVMHGKPVIRNMRFSLTQMLELIGGGIRVVVLLAHTPNTIK